MWRNSDFKIYFSVLKIYFKAMAPPFMTIHVSAKAATQSFVTFSLRRVLGGCVSVWFRAATQSFVTFFLRRVLGDCVSVLFCAATQSFGLFFLRRVLFNEFLRGERVGQVRDEVSDQSRMMRFRIRIS